MKDQELYEIDLEVAVKHQQNQGNNNIKDQEIMEFKEIEMFEHMKWSRLRYSVAEKSDILGGIDGYVQAGQMLAILGPSGSGKTTLLNALGGRLKGATGEILVDDRPWSKQMKRRTCFVMQDDVLHDSLTVEETLRFTGLMKLSSSLSEAEKLEKVEDIIQSLGLDKCRNSRIGNAMVRGISGGERKRVNVANELMNDPSILIFDEPTSGLDASTSLSVIKVMRKLADEGRIVICSIHQPSSRIYYQFDKVMLLTKGRCIYDGAPDNLLPHFENIGYPCEANWNPADFCLELANNDETADSIISLLDEEEGKKEDVLDMEDSDNEAEKLVGSKWSTTWVQQFKLLQKRSFLIRQRGSLDKLNFIQFTILGLLLGLLYQNNSSEETLDSRLGILFFNVTFWAFQVAFEALMLFPAERGILMKERASGSYRLSAYFLSKSLSEMPFSLLFPSLYTIIVYWMAELNSEAERFVLHLLTLWLICIVAESYGYLLSIAIPDFKRVLAVVTVLSLFLMMIGGYFVDAGLIPEWIRWARYLSMFRLGFVIFSYIEFHGTVYECSSENSIFSDSECPVSGEDILEKYGLDDDVSLCIGLLCAYLIVYRIGAYAFLRSNTKQSIQA